MQKYTADTPEKWSQDPNVATWLLFVVSNEKAFSLFFLRCGCILYDSIASQLETDAQAKAQQQRRNTNRKKDTENKQTEDNKLHHCRLH